MLYGVGQKSGLFLKVDNFATARVRNALDILEDSKFYLEKTYKTWMSVKLNVLCVGCINIQCI